jgi:hypothetical protein
MTSSDMFKSFLRNIQVDKGSIIDDRYKKITKQLNLYFRNTDSDTENSIRVGSYGRWTGIKGISDLDILYIMKEDVWDKYKNDPRKTLDETKTALVRYYSTTKIKVDRLVVDMFFSDGTTFEVQPVFQRTEDGKIFYYYPDTYYGGSWKKTMPKQEQEAMTDGNNDTNSNLRRLCKMLRSWKNYNGVAMGGLLVDTLAYNYLTSTGKYNDKSYNDYGEMSYDFFNYLQKESPKSYYLALGSNQQVKVKQSFHKAAVSAYKKCEEALAKDEEDKRQKCWRELYGRDFPDIENIQKSAYVGFRNTEEFIEDKYPVDIRYSLKIDCKVNQSGFREMLLREILSLRYPLKHGKSLDFFISNTDLENPDRIVWKVRNCGEIAEKIDDIRGQLIFTSNMDHHENTRFDGPHYVECYMIKNGVVVARDHIDVPINNAQS